MANTKHLNFFLFLLNLLVILMFIQSCKKDEPIPPPSISSFTPTTGSAGTIVTITGANFSSTSSIVAFNGTTAVVTSASQTSLTTAVPEGASTGKITVTVNNNTATSSSDFTVNNSPEITSFTPSSGLPGTIIMITGKKFSSVKSENSIFINNVACTVTDATKTSLSIIVPDAATTGKITITVNGLTTLSESNFIVPPVITDFSPLSGKVGSSVTITGARFSLSNGSNVVKFNNRVATVTNSTATSLVAVVPMDALTDKVTVTVDGQTATSATDFAVIPDIANISPRIGAIGSTVVITGTGFSSIPSNNIVKFGTTQATVTLATGSSLTVLVPVGATSNNISITLGANSAITASPYQVAIEAIGDGGPNFDEAYAIAADNLGNIFVTGSFEGTANFGSTAITSAGSDDIYIAKYNTNYDLVWVKQFGGTSSDVARSITIDANGAIFISGMIGGTVSFGSTTLNPVGGGIDGFVAKLSSTGDCIWANQIGNASAVSEIVFSVKTDASGNPLVTGGFGQSLTIGATTLTSNGQSDVFLIKYDGATGNPIWARNYGGTDDDHGISIAVGSTGNIFISGSFFGTMPLASSSLVSAGSFDAFVAKLNSNGDAVWATQIGGTSNDNVLSLATVSDTLYVGGYFTGSAAIGSTSMTAAGNEDAFIAKYKPSGDLIWAKKFGGNDYDHCQSIVVDGASIYATGYFSRDAQFQNITLTSSNNSNDVFVSKLNSSGNIVWATKAGGTDSDNGQAITLDNSGAIHITGSYRQPGTFNATPLQNSGNDDIFLWRIWQ